MRVLDLFCGAGGAAMAEHGQAIADYLESYPAATAVDVAVEVLGIDPYDARCAWAELHPGDEAS